MSKNTSKQEKEVERESNTPEVVFSYASGTFSQKDKHNTPLDYTPIAVLNALIEFCIDLLKPFILHTDCEAIVAFYNKHNENLIDGYGFLIVLQKMDT